MYTRNLVLLTVLSFIAPAGALSQEPRATALRAGMIGLDTSHVPAFTRIFNDAKAAGDLEGIKVVAGYPGGTDLPASRDRVARFTEQVQGMGIEIVDSIPKLLEKVDVVMLESVDGRIHLQEAIPVIKAGKPLWIDKPVAGSLADALLIFELAKKHNVPCFSSSSARFSPGLAAVLEDEAVGPIVGAATWGPCSYSTGTPDMFFYGIHGIEPLFVLMGRGCETVSRVQTDNTDLVTGVWKEGRVGTYRGIRRGANVSSGATAFGSKAIVQPEKGGGGYEALCREIGRFFKTGKSPVSAEETIEIFAFMEAADESKRQGGAPVSLAAVLAKAKAEAAAKLAAVHGADEPQGIDPRAAVVIRAAGQYLQQLKTFRCECATTFKVTLGEKTNELAAEYSIALQRPNRVALLLKRGEMGASVVSDGKQAYHVIPAMKRYTVEAAPETLDELLKPESTIFFGQGAAILLPTLLAADPTKALLEGVSAGKHLGEEEIDKTKCHRLRFSQQEMDWDVWVETGDRPLIRRLSLDVSKSLAQARQALDLKNAKMEVILTLTDWKPNTELAADVFQFQPPADAKRVESLLGGLLPRDEPEQHTLLGKPAPEFEAILLEGKTLKLSDLKGKVVILDFWASWCGPCVKALPIIVQVAKEHEKRGVTLFAVNVGEEPGVIRDFLKEQKLQVEVVLDPQSKLSEDYGVQGIPQTVLIGKDGKVQVVHVGLTGDLKDRLGKELDALLKGEDLAAKAVPKSEDVKFLPDEAVGQARLLWSVPGLWTAVAADGDVAVAVESRGGRPSAPAIQIDALGNKQHEFAIASSPSVLRIARLSHDKRALLAYSVWGHSLEAYSLAGEHLWSHDGGQGIDDVWAFDLNGDKLDEVVIGYNGNTGLHVLDAQGKPLWKYTEIGNVWHVSAGDVIGDERPEVVTTSAAGKVHLFDREGKKLKDIDAGLYATLVRVARPVGGAKAAVIVGGSQGAGSALARLDGDGTKRWSLPLDGRMAIASAQIAGSRPWIGVSQRNGSLVIVDLAQDKVLARIPEQGDRSQVAWLERTGQSPVLLVATGGDLNAFVVQEPD